ncbi:13882_t:CDS:2, partial [Acaulospora colombiana]
MALSLQRQTELRNILVLGQTYPVISQKLSIAPSTISKYKKKRPAVALSTVSYLDGPTQHLKSSGCLDFELVIKQSEMSSEQPTSEHALKQRRPYSPLATDTDTPDDWARIIFSDEMKINRMGSDGRRYCWKAPGEELSRRTVQATVKHGGGSVMVWGSMTMKGVGRMCFIDGIMDATKYVKILDQHLLATAREHSMHRSGFTFQQDGDPKHTSAKARNWFQDHRVNVLKWPAQSPDLNPIEHLWDHLKRRLNSYEDHPSSIHELERRIEVEWNNIDPE